MTKKIFALIIAIVFALFTTSVFASNTDVGESLNKAGSSIRNVVNGAETVIEDGAKDLVDGAKDMGNNMENADDNRANEQDNMNPADTMAGTIDNGNNNGGYTATRTSSTTNGNTFLGMSANTWTWFVLAIAALAIIALVWYYAMQNKSDYEDNH